MKKILLFLCIILTISLMPKPIRLTTRQAQAVGKKIWRNECGGSIEGLLFWNKNESFASVGIGHFLWCPKGKSRPFSHSFPSLIEFMVQHGIKVPEWLDIKNGCHCPWRTRREFIQARNSKKMKELEAFLVDTIDAQIAFMVKRLDDALPKILAAVPHHKKMHIKRQFDCLMRSEKGLYALIDYINFKGEGISHAKKENGWGLLQVLETMHAKNDEAAVRQFVDSAKQLLTNRTQRDPSTRCWLEGWHNRLNTYLV